jgi:hypothetical protein
VLARQTRPPSHRPLFSRNITDDLLFRESLARFISIRPREGPDSNRNVEEITPWQVKRTILLQSDPLGSNLPPKSSLESTALFGVNPNSTGC